MITILASHLTILKLHFISCHVIDLQSGHGSDRGGYHSQTQDSSRTGNDYSRSDRKFHSGSDSQRHHDYAKGNDPAYGNQSHGGYPPHGSDNHSYGNQAERRFENNNAELKCRDRSYENEPYQYNQDARGRGQEFKGRNSGYQNNSYDRSDGNDAGWYSEQSNQRGQQQSRYDTRAPMQGQSIPDEKGGKPKSRDTIYISGMGSDINENKVADFFGKIGIIKADKLGKLKIWMYYDKMTGLPKGDATLTYEDEATCTQALEWFNDQPFFGRNIKVERADYYDWEAKRTSGQGGRGRGRGRGRF
jgi:hypothetical protein